MIVSAKEGDETTRRIADSADAMDAFGVYQVSASTLLPRDMLKMALAPFFSSSPSLATARAPLGKQILGEREVYNV